MEYKVLNNGLKMPMVGLGVYNINAVLMCGYMVIPIPISTPLSATPELSATSWAIRFRTSI